MNLERLLEESASIAQGIYEFIVGLAAASSRGGLCLTTVVGCSAAAPAIATGTILTAHGGTLAVNSASEFGDKLRDILSPNRMASSGGADDIIGLSRETGISQGSISNVYDDLNPSDIKLIGDKLNKNNVESLFEKADGGNTGSELVQNVTKIVKIFAKDADAIADIQENLSFNQVNKRGKQFLDDSQLREAFTEATKFIDKYKGRVSGAFANRFGKAAAKGNNLSLPNPRKLDFTQAAGEIKTAEDILDGVTPLGSDVKMRGLPEINGQKNPDFLATLSGGNTRLVEVKTLEGSFAKTKINTRLSDAIRQIVGNSPITKPTNNAYIRLDFRNANATQDRADFLFNAVKDRLEFTNKGKITPGIQVVEFVELLYKDANQAGQVRSILVQVKNGVPTLLN